MYAGATQVRVWRVFRPGRGRLTYPLSERGLIHHLPRGLTVWVENDDCQQFGLEETYACVDFLTRRGVSAGVTRDLGHWAAEIGISDPVAALEAFLVMTNNLRCKYPGVRADDHLPLPFGGDDCSIDVRRIPNSGLVELFQRDGGAIVVENQVVNPLQVLHPWALWRYRRATRQTLRRLARLRQVARHLRRGRDLD